ncbi:MAG: ArnT family glycosyltransferase [Acidobacteriota bacterium]
MEHRKPLAFLLAAALAVLLYGNGWVGLFESSEARYAEVAREMAHTGDFLSPQIDYVYHFTKPPLTYWLTTLGYALFGETPFGARFFLAIAALWVLVLTAGIHGLLAPRRPPWIPAGILASSLLFLAMGKVLTTDMFLTLWVTAGFFLWLLAGEGRLSPRAFSLLFAATAAAAFLTKGPIAFLFWFLGMVPAALARDRGRSLRPFADPLLWLVFLLLALPWFVAVGLRHPGLLGFLATREATEAAYSAKRFHPGPWYYYIPVLLAGFFPWWSLLPPTLGRPKGAGKVLLLSWAFLPPLLWSFFPAKLPTYVLPSLPAWALLAAEGWEEALAPSRGRGLSALPPLLAGLFAGALALYAGERIPGGLGGPFLIWTASGAASGLLGAFLALRNRRSAALLLALLAMASVALSLPHAAAAMGDGAKTVKRLGEELASLRRPGEAVLEYRVTLFSIPFYVRDRVAAYDNNFLRKKFVAGRPGHILETRDQLARFAAENPALWVVTDDDGEKTLAGDLGGLGLVFREGRHSLWASEKVLERLRPGRVPPRPAGPSAGGGRGRP